MRCGRRPAAHKLGNEGCRARQIETGRRRQRDGEAIGFLLGDTHRLRGRRAHWKQSVDDDAFRREPPAMMQQIVRELVAEHQRQFVIGRAAEQETLADHHARPVGPGVDVPTGRQFDVRRTAEIGRES